jgi:hypothetical protein
LKKNIPDQSLKEKLKSNNKNFPLKVSPSQPDPPSEVEVIAFDDDSVHLMWKPGFDGGFNQTFDLQVKISKPAVHLLKLKFQTLKHNRFMMLLMRVES